MLESKKHFPTVEGGLTPFKTPLTIWGPLAAILDFVGGVALQDVNKCPQPVTLELNLMILTQGKLTFMGPKMDLE